MLMAPAGTAHPPQGMRVSWGGSYPAIGGNLRARGRSNEEEPSVTARTPGSEAVAAAMCETLSLYPWRRFTPHLFARLALAAHDRQSLEDVLATVQGAAVGSWGVLEPAERDDARVGPLLDLLARHRWTELRLSTLCRKLSGVLES